MSSKQLVALAVRMFAIFIAVWVMRHGFVVVPMLAGPDATRTDLLAVFLTVSVPLVVAVLLWVFPARVAGHLLPRTSTPARPEPWTAAELQAAAFSVLGMWILARAVADLGYWIVYLLLLPGSGAYRSSGLSPADLGGLVSTALELVIGVWLLLGARGLAGVIRRFRHGAAAVD